MPLAVSATTFKGRSSDVSTNERTWSAYSSRRSRRLTDPGFDDVGTSPALACA